MAMKRVRLIVKGRVQGVFYRKTTGEVARSLGLTGFVRNLSNKDVEIVVEGDSDVIAKLIEWARIGPPHADVKDLLIEYSDYTGQYDKFMIDYRTHKI